MSKGPNTTTHSLDVTGRALAEVVLQMAELGAPSGAKFGFWSSADHEAKIVLYWEVELDDNGEEVLPDDIVRP